MVAVVWGTGPTRDIARRTNAEGMFQVGLEPGRYRLRASAQGASGEVEVEGAGDGEILIRIGPPEAGAGNDSR